MQSLICWAGGTLLMLLGCCGIGAVSALVTRNDKSDKFDRWFIFIAVEAVMLGALLWRIA